MEKEKKLWFKAKRYGWGWTPVTWQGWAVIVVYLAVLLRFFLAVTDQLYSLGDTILSFLLVAAAPTLILIWICYKKGEAPRWSWGDKKK